MFNFGALIGLAGFVTIQPFEMQKLKNVLMRSISF